MLKSNKKIGLLVYWKILAIKYKEKVITCNLWVHCTKPQPLDYNYWLCFSLQGIYDKEISLLG